MEPPSEALLDRLEALYEGGRYLDAYEAAQAAAPLKRWRGPRARLIAGSLATQLGAPRLGRALYALAFREGPTDAAAAYRYGAAIAETRGPLAAWRFLRRVGPLDDPREVPAGQWLALRGAVLSMVSDFNGARQALDEAQARSPRDPWLHVARAGVYLGQGRHEAALDVLRYALEQRPGFRPAVQSRATVLAQLGRVDEAIALLSAHLGQLQSALIARQLAVFYLDAGDPLSAEGALELYEGWMPLAEPAQRRDLQLQRFYTAYTARDFEAALQLVAGVEASLPPLLTERLREAEAQAGARVSLAVPMVRQLQKTCAPATLTAVARYWGETVDQHQVAHAIAYEGTPHHAERAWAERRGWRVREHQVSWEAAVALLDRGVPFTLTTVNAEVAHLQAVVGYDLSARTLIIRDPAHASLVEVSADPFLERYAATGPRGLALAPADEAGRLEGLELPCEALYDARYQFDRALAAHDPEAAAEALHALQALDPDHRLTLEALASLSQYRGDTEGLMGALDALRRLAPGELHLARRALEFSRGERPLAQWLEEVNAAFEGTRAAPVGWRLRAEVLAKTQEGRGEALRLLERAIRNWPMDADAFGALGGLYLEEGRGEEAREILRMATSLNPFDEGHAEAYFDACLRCGRPEEGLDLLQRRSRHLGDRSGGPAGTLFNALARLGRPGQGLRALERARRRRPEDGEFALAAARAFLALGQLERAQALTAGAAGVVAPRRLARAEAHLAERSGALEAACALWGERVEAEPGATDALLASLSALSGLGRWEEALQVSARLAATRPNDPFAQAQAAREALARRWPQEALPQLEAALAGAPWDLGLRRALFEALAALGQHEAGVAIAAAGVSACPWRGEAWALLAEARGAVFDYVGAAEAYDRALERALDQPAALSARLELCPSPEARIALLGALEARLDRCGAAPGAARAWLEAARPLLGDAAADAATLRWWEARRWSWPYWALRADALLRQGDARGLRAFLTQATRAFPGLPDPWAQLARVCETPEEGLRALSRALDAHPLRPDLVILQARLWVRGGAQAEARAALEAARQAHPLHSGLRLTLAQLVLSDDPEAAVALLAPLAALPAPPEALWELLLSAGQGEAAVALARGRVREGPPAAAAHHTLARVQAMAGEEAAAIAGLRAHLEQRPWDEQGRDLMAELCAEAGDLQGVRWACGASESGEIAAHSPALLARLGASLLELGEPEPAAQALEAALLADPLYPWALSLLAQARRQLGDGFDACEALDRLVEIDDDPFAALFQAGNARRALGDLEAAAERFQRLLALRPGDLAASLSLVEIQQDRGEHEDSKAALQEMSAHPEVSLRRLRGALKAGAAEGALEAFDELLRWGGSALERGWRWLAPGGLASEAKALIGARVAEGLASEDGQALWRQLNQG